MQKFIHRNRKGFSLIELIVVMAVMAILVLLAAPRFLGYTKDAAVSAMQADAKVLSNAALQYNIKTEAWPIGATEATIAVTDDLGKALIDITDATDLAGIQALDVFAIDVDANDGTVHFDSLVKNTKNPISEYYLITAGNYAGEVFHIETLEDSSGEIHNGVHKVTTP